jgi:hypothetical protein
MSMSSTWGGPRASDGRPAITAAQRAARTKYQRKPRPNSPAVAAPAPKPKPGEPNAKQQLWLAARSDYEIIRDAATRMTNAES